MFRPWVRRETQDRVDRRPGEVGSSYPMFGMKNRPLGLKSIFMALDYPEKSGSGYGTPEALRKKWLLKFDF